MKLELIACFLIWILQETAASNGTVSYESEKVNEVHLLSRRKRYIVFPKGSSLQLLLEVLIHVPTRFKVFVGPTIQIAWPMPTDINSNVFINKKKIFADASTLMDMFGTTIGLAWQLPDDPMIYSEYKKKHKIYKRAVFKKMEAFFGPAGANGRQCVLKALCESGQRTPSRKEFLHEILHKVFSMDGDDDDLDNHEDKLYKRAHRSVNQNCDVLYPECKFSLFDAIK